MQSAIDILLLALIAFYFVVLFKSARGGGMRIGRGKKKDKSDQPKDGKSDERQDDNIK